MYKNPQTFDIATIELYLCIIVQKLIALILLLAFTGQTFRQGFYYIDYVIDKAEYVKNCINKARPKMQCNGKCQLMKKIEEQEKREQQKAPEMKLAGKVEVIPAKNFMESPDNPESITARLYIITNEGSPIDQFSAIFHPPST